MEVHHIAADRDSHQEAFAVAADSGQDTVPEVDVPGVDVPEVGTALEVDIALGAGIVLEEGIDLVEEHRNLAGRTAVVVLVHSPVEGDIVVPRSLVEEAPHIRLAVEGWSFHLCYHNWHRLHPTTASQSTSQP